MRLMVLLLAAAIPLAFVPTTAAEDPSEIIDATILLEGDSWLDDCYQYDGAIYLWDRPVCNPGNGCQNGGANLYVLTENQCADETCEGDVFIFLLSEGNCHECDGEVINPGVANCRPDQLVEALLGS